jgi:NADPH2:quinone reductase
MHANERTMYKRIVVTRYGGPDELQLVESPRPEPKSGEVRVRVLAAGVSLPDVMMREGIHPETPTLPFTPGWDLVGVVDRLGDGVSGVEPGQRVLIHGAAGGVGSALLQLGRIAGLEMYGTCSARAAADVSELGGIPIDYQHQDFVTEIHRLTSDGVDAVFDGIGGTNIWRSRKALRPGGKVVAFGLTGSLNQGRLASGRSGSRQRFRRIAILARRSSAPGSTSASHRPPTGGSALPAAHVPA